MSKTVATNIYVICILFFAVFFFWPIGQILQGAFIDADGHFTLSYFLEVFANPLYLEGLYNSFRLAFYSTLLALLISLPLALIADRFVFKGRTLLMGLILLPIMLPPFVGAIGIRQIMGQYGALNAFLIFIGFLPDGQTIDWLGKGQFWGVVVMTALGLYPILYLNAISSLANIDPSMEEASENLGCRGFKKFFRISLPLMRPGLFAGCTIVFIWSFTELGVPLIFDYGRLTSVQIFYGITDIGGNPFPYALVTVMLIFSLIFYALGKGLFGRNTYSMMGKASVLAQPKKLGPIGSILSLCFFSLIIFISLLPHFGVIILSLSSDWYQSILPHTWTLQNYELALGHNLTLSSIKNSLIYASSATVINVILGVGIAYVVVRSRLPGREALDVMAMLPLAVPGLVIAFGYLAMSREGKLFDFINPVENPMALLIIAYAVRRLPLVVRSAVAGLQQTSDTYEEAAQSLGCVPIKAAIFITIPLITANLLAGALLAFSQAMLEVSDSLILAQKAQYYPITKSIYELIHFLGDGRYISSALGVWAMIFLSVTIFGVSILMGKKLGAIFRF